MPAPYPPQTSASLVLRRRGWRDRGNLSLRMPRRRGPPRWYHRQVHGEAIVTSSTTPNAAAFRRLWWGVFLVAFPLGILAFVLPIYGRELGPAPSRWAPSSRPSRLSRWPSVPSSAGPSTDGGAGRFCCSGSGATPRR